MSRLPRKAVVRPECYYHLVARGNDKARIFHCESDYRRYLEFVTEAKARYRVFLYHYVLMPNHIHMEVEPTEGDLSSFMHAIQSPYAKFYCKKYGRVGHVWQGRFKCSWIDTDAYLFACGNYIELNPIRAKLVKKTEDWPFSSYRFYAFGEKDDLIDADPLYFELHDDPGIRQQMYRKLIENAVKNSPVPKVPGTS